MAGLGPPIHDFDFGVALKSWMPAPSAGMTVFVKHQALSPPAIRTYTEPASSS